MEIIEEDNRDEKPAIIGTYLTKEGVIIPREELAQNFQLNVAPRMSAPEQQEIQNNSILNHAEVLIGYTKSNNESQFIMYDPTNVSIKTIDFETKIPERDPIDLRYNIRDIYSSKETEESKIDLIKRYIEIAPEVEKRKRKGISRRELELLLHYAEIQCTKSKDEIEKFYKENITWYSIITDQKSLYVNEVQNNSKDTADHEDR